MKLLLVTQRFPWPPYTGERLRATTWLAALARTAEVSVVSPGGDVPRDAPPIRLFAARRSLLHALRGAVAVLRHRLPLQCLLGATHDWASAIADAREAAGPFDATIVILSRLDPWVRASLEGRTLLDAVDSLRRSAAERAKAAAPALRWLWRMEERRMARLEREAIDRYERVLVVSEEETAELRAIAIPMGIDAAPLDAAAPRAFDFGFWGRLPYFANADAASWLLREIWPAIRALHPSATLVIGGAGASRALRAEARRSGVTLVSPIDDMRAFARSIRVALMPLRYGSGQSNKILEAAEAGCALVGTPCALRGLTALAEHSRIEETAQGFARAAVALIADDALRAAEASALRTAIETHYDRATTRDRMRAIAFGEAAA
jgi:glycosyltransferase involved in cell wall biosynthesis